MKAGEDNEIKIILQHQFWDLIIDDHKFSVVLSFNGKKKNISVPFNSITSFSDPSVGFSLQFKKDLNQMRQISTINFNKNLVVDINQTLLETLVILQKYKGAAVAVCKNKKLAGIFTTGDLNRLIERKKKFNYSDRMVNFISKKPFSVDISDKVEAVTNIVKKYY